MTSLPKTIEVSLEAFRDLATMPLLQRSREALRKAQRHLLGLQKPGGYWVGELIVDSTLVSDVVAFMHWTGEVDFNKQSACVKHCSTGRCPTAAGPPTTRAQRAQRHAESLLRAQLAGFPPRTRA